MTTNKIDCNELEVATLSDEAKCQLASVRFLDSGHIRLLAKFASVDTARMAYLSVLKVAL